MRKVVKFGGSSLASAQQFKKVAEIVHAEASRRYVVPSAPGKRFRKDTKVTDMLYGCYALAEQDEDFSENLHQIEERYQEIIADYNKDKDDAEIQRVFDDLMTLHDSLDQEEQRYIREGFKTEKELAVFDLLSKDKTSITKGDIDKIKKVAQELMDTVEKRRQEMGDLRDRASSQAQMKAAIIDRLLEGMPDEFSSEDIEARAEVIYQYVETHMQSAAVH